MNLRLFRSRWYRSVQTALLCTLSVFTAAHPVLAQAEIGEVRGNVISAASLESLAGAIVSIPSLNLTTFTDRDGKFHLPRTPLGSHQLQVNYSGFEASTQTINVGRNAVTELQIPLEARAVFTMEQFTIVAEREGNALAIAQQRAADNVQNVISADAFGSSAEGNVADQLQRLPGIVVNYTAADPREVSIRGISADLTTVTIDGARQANAGGSGERTFSFADMSNVSLLESIEVAKALTPEMDAASVGGLVNLRTRSPLSSGVTNRLTFRAGANIETATDSSQRLQPAGTATYIKVFGKDRRVGLMLNATYTPYFHIQDTVRTTFQATTNVPAYITSFDFVDGPKLTNRYSGGARLDLKLTNSWTVYLNTLYNYYQADLNNRTFALTTVAASVAAGYTEYVTTANPSANTRSTITMNSNQVTMESYRLQPGSRHTFNGWDIDYDGTFSRSARLADRAGRLGNVTSFLPNISWRVDRSSEFPQWTVMGGPDYMNLDNYANMAYTQGRTTADDEVLGGQINIRKSLPLKLPLDLKAGGRFHQQTRELGGVTETYNFVGADGVNGGDDRLSRFRETEYRRDPTIGGYRSPNYISTEAVAEHFRTSPTEFVWNAYNNTRDTLRANREAEEQVYAGYVQGRVRVGKFSLLTGVRVERTEVMGEGVVQGPILNTITNPATGQTRKETPQEANQRIANETVAQRTARTAAENARRAADPQGAAFEEWGTRRRATGSYNNHFPSAHLRYEPRRGLVARASYSTGIGRPSFTNLMPNETVNFVNETVTASNPGLSPQYAKSYDVSIEYYFEPAGSLTAGIFRKDITDFIYSDNSGTVPFGSDNGFSGLYEGYALTTFRNGGFARVEGLELSYRQQYTFLPGWLRGLSSFANYTRLRTDGDYGGTTPQTTGTLPGFVPEFANFGISYRYNRFSIGGKWNYKSRTLFAYNANAASLRYYPRRTTVDVNLRVVLTKQLSLYADVINLTREPTIFERGFDTGRFDNVSSYGRKVSFGISGQF